MLRQGGGGVVGISRVSHKVYRGLEMPLRAFCCKARGGGGRLRHATVGEKRKNV